MSSGFKGWNSKPKNRVTCPVCGLKVGLSVTPPGYEGLASFGEMYAHNDPNSTRLGCPGSRKTPEQAADYMLNEIVIRIAAAQESLNAPGDDHANLG